MPESSTAVLLVGNDPTGASSITALLKNNGYAVLTEASFGEAIGVIERGIHINLALIDLEAEGIIESAHAAETIILNHDIPAMFLYGNNGAPPFDRLKNVLSCGYINKNAEEAAILASINSAVRLQKSLFSGDKYCKKPELPQNDIASLTHFPESSSFTAQLLEASPIGIMFLDSRGLIKYENRAMARMMGVPEGIKSPAVGMNIYEIAPVMELGVDDILRRVISGETVTGVEFHYRSLMGKEVDIEVNAAPVFSEKGALEGGIIMANDITAKKQAEQVIKKFNSEAAFLSRKAIEFIELPKEHNIFEFIAKSLLELLPDFYIFINEFNNEDSFSTLKAMEGVGAILKTGIRILGRNPIGLRSPIPPEQKKHLLSQKIVIGPGGLTELTHGIIPEKIGAALYKLMNAGTIYGMGFSNQDMLLGHVVLVAPRGATLENYSIVESFIKLGAIALQRHQAEKALSMAVREKENLFIEYRHRVKNGFAIINGLISLEAKREADPAIQGVLTDMRNRIGAMSKLYDLLNRSFGTDETRLDSYLRQLSDVLYSTYLADHGAVKLELLLDEMHIDTHMAMSIGLIFNELFTNALKYAFRASGHGTIRITLKSVKENGVLEISDDGAGLPENFDIQKSGGLGMEIVRMLAVQIKGKLEVERAARTAFRITFPRVHKA